MMYNVYTRLRETTAADALRHRAQEVNTMTNTTNTDKTRDLVIERMLKAGWFATTDCKVVDKDGNAVTAPKA